MPLDRNRCRPLVQSFDFRSLFIAELGWDNHKAALASRMGVPPSRITRLLGGSENLTIATLVRAGRAVGAELKLTFQSANASAGTPENPATSSVSNVAEEPVHYRATRKS
jgi:plasmid maintenance system antidote protein VapI